MRDDIKRLRRFFLLFRSHWFSYGISSAMVSCRNLIITWLTAFISSRVVAVVSEGGDIDLLRELMRFLLLLLVFILFDTVGQYVLANTILKIGNTLRKSIHHSILATSIQETSRFGQRSELISRMNSDVDTATSFLSGGLITLAMFVVSGIGATVIIARESLDVCIGLYLLGLVGLLIQTKLAKQMRGTSSSMRNESAGALSVYMQTLSRSADIRMAGLSNAVSDSFCQKIQVYRKYGKKLSTLNGISEGFGEIIQFTGFFGVIGVCLYLYSLGRMSLPDIVMVSQMATLVLRMILTVFSSVKNVHTSLAGIDRIFEIIDLPAETLSGSEFLALSDGDESALVYASNAACQFKNGISAFTDLNITVPANCITALSGDSGCGKTTLMRLLLKLYSYSAGSIKLFGAEVKECSVLSIRRAVAYVPQENVIFSGTFRDNLLIGNHRKIGDTEIHNVLAGIGADTWVCAADNGLDTLISDGGNNLSGGQRQMIAIARAILYRREILVLDEAFAGIDELHVRRIVDYIRRLEKTRSVVIITHDTGVSECCDITVRM